MNPNQSYKQQILDIIQSAGGISARHIRSQLPISEPTLFKHLNRLIEEKQIQKVGLPPKVIYTMATSSQWQTKVQSEQIVLENFVTDSLETNFVHITPDGKILYGVEGFVFWCHKQGLDVGKRAVEYVQTLAKYQKYAQDGIIDASFKLEESFGSASALDKLFYLDFYAIERFGKTKLAQLSFQAKQSEDARLMQQIIDLCRAKIVRLMESLQIQAVAFVPPTVDRKVQFQTELQRGLSLPLPHFKLVKVKLDTPVQQKTLKSKGDRVINATTTIFVDDNRTYGNLLLIDDFVGSGATLNETAKKIRQRGLVSGFVYGLGLTGSFKGFEVVSQM